jgi:Phosphotransferase enzyme family
MLDENQLRKLRQSLASHTIIDVVQLPDRTQLPDSTEKYFILTTDETFILLISNEISPLMVKHAVERQREAIAHLHRLTAAPIEMPIFTDFMGERSYAVWRKRQPLSSNRIRSKIERMLLAPRIFRWLREIASQTATAVNPSILIDDTRRLQDIPAMPSFIKIAAEKACDAILLGKIPAIQVLQHGDLWIGNILKAPSKRGFVVIDWAGARLDGSPFFDLVKFALSVGATNSKLRQEISMHSKIINCDPRYARVYVLRGLGALHRQIEYFPESDFVLLCERKLHALEAAS